MRNLSALLALALLALPALAQERPAYTVRALEGGAIEIDGRLDEAVWQQQPTFELAYETRPAENTASPVRTEVWLTYDSSNLYAAFRAHDPEPGSIRARYSDRDAATNDDYVGIILDTFNDQRRGFEFFVNPLGVQMDLMQNEMTGAEDASWDAIWDSAGRTTAAGYEVELRIPFSSLRFPSATGEMTWGIDAYRNYPRGQSYRLGLVPIRRGNNCYLCQNAALVGLGGVRPARSIELHPTVTSAQYGERNAVGRFETGNANTEAGLTAQWGITPNFTLSGTINPDFSQVEADAAQLAVNTNFALYYPEKRPFFLEGADLFDTRFQAMYSRNIADPEWGVKLTGKSGKNAFGAIVAMDRQTNFLVPSGEESRLFAAERENLSTILRYRRDLFGATTGGFFYTGREGDDGYHNRMLGGDILFRWRGTKAFRLELMGSSTRYPEDIAAAAEQRRDAFTGHGLRAVYQHTSANWMYYLAYRDVAEGFRADLGFVPRADFRERGAALERAWYPATNGWSQVRLGSDALSTDDQDGDHLETRANVYAWAQGPRQSFLRVDLTSADQTYRGGRFDTDRVTLYGEVQARPDVFVYAQTIVGNQIDFASVQQGEQVRFDPGVRWNAGQHLRLNLGHFYETLDVEGGRLFTANLTELRATYQFNNRTFVRWIGQHLDVDRAESHSRDVFNQLLFSYKINPFTVLFAGYSDTWAAGTRLDLAQQSRTLFLKVGYAWQV
ncbi:MAG TPA: DUF5916 domain-containing protein [Thermoanaerobaculia bacterium]|jgi:hypothetical protein